MKLKFKKRLLGLFAIPFALCICLLNVDKIHVHAAALQTSTTTVTFTAIPTCGVYSGTTATNTFRIFCPFKVAYTYGDNKCVFPDGFRLAQEGPGIQSFNPVEIYYTGNPVSNVSSIIYSTITNPNTSDGNVSCQVNIDFYDESGTGVFGCGVVLFRQPTFTHYNILDWGFGPDDDVLYTINVNDTSQAVIQSSYNTGFEAGKAQGKIEGYNKGKAEGVEASNKYTFMNLLNSVFYAPIHALYSLLNFEIFGVNVYSVVTGILSALVLIGLVMFVLKVVK